jgi:hypothetical protein
MNSFTDFADGFSKAQKVERAGNQITVPCGIVAPLGMITTPSRMW